MKFFLHILSVVLCLNASAQVVKVAIEDRSRYMQHSFKWTYKEKNGFKVGDNIIQVENTAPKMQIGYTARFRGMKHGIIINKTDATGNALTTNKLEDGEKVFGPFNSVPIEFDGRILIFYFRYTDSDTMQLYVSELDKKNLQLVNTTNLFNYYHENYGILKLSRDNDKEITVVLSPDKSKLLVSVPGIEGEVFSGVIEKELHMLRKKVTKVPGSEDLLLTAAFVDNLGNTAIALSKPGVSFGSSSNPTGKKLILHKSNNTEKIADVTALGASGDIHNIRFQASKDQTRLYAFGDYDGSIGKAGLCLAEILPENLKVNRARLLPYPEEFSKNVYAIGFGARKKGEYGINSAEMELVEFDNGDLALCGSPIEIADKTNSVDGKMDGYVLFYTGPVMVAFLNGKKEPVFTMIPRHQNSCNGSNSVFLPYQDKLLILYNDYAKNINGPLKPDDVHQKGGSIVKELSLAYAIVKKDGTIEERKLLHEGLSRMNYYNTALTEIIDAHKLLVPSASVDKKTDEQKVAVITIE